MGKEEEEEEGFKIQNAWKIWMWGELAIGIILFIIYVLAGAAIFSTIEKKVSHFCHLT